MKLLITLFYPFSMTELSIDLPKIEDIKKAEMVVISFQDEETHDPLRKHKLRRRRR